MDEGLPKVEVDWMEILWHCETVETLSVIISSALSKHSLFWTSMPPGRSSHLISPPPTLPLAAAALPLADDADFDELVLENFFDLSFIIFNTIDELIAIRSFIQIPINFSLFLKTTFGGRWCTY